MGLIIFRHKTGKVGFMGQEEYRALLNRLKKRFNSCYDEYMKKTLELDKKQIYEASFEIAAIKETHTEICFWLELSMCKKRLPCGAGEQTDAGRRPGMIAKQPTGDTQYPAGSDGLIKEPMSEQDAAGLLALENPLTELALKWWFFNLGNKANFHDFYKAEKNLV